ncbi:hypothetical protein [Streptomyces sp. NPDC020917]|uniref:hypothetical protein n=1 Tax=Streptomyces sp. NPDC020917 TaxID=3365102 RepID=UPI0037BC0958
MTTATQSSRRPAKRAAKSTAKSPKGAAARGRSSTTTRSTKGKGKASSGGGRGGQGRGKAESRAKSGGRTKAHEHDHDMTITIPIDSAANAVGKVVTLPVTAAQRILPAAGGLPLYMGLGALGIVGVLEWPVAAGIGVGYAVLRQGGPLNPHPDKDAVK